MRIIAALALGVGCRGPVLERPTTPASEVEGGSFERLVVEPSIGPAPLEVPIRAVNSLGVPLASTSRTVTVDGEDRSVSFDGYGHGSLVLELPGTYEIDDGVRRTRAHVVDSDWPGLGLDEAVPSPGPGMELVGTLSDGLLVADERAVYYVTAGSPPQVVLEAPLEIVGLATGNLDTDGVLDAVVWTPTTVYGLRGRPAGGMSWGNAWEAPGYSVAGADVGDLSGNGLPDLAIAWAAGRNNNWLDIWESDGLWNFTPAIPRKLSNVPTYLAIGDNTGEGKPQITCTTEQGFWDRFIEAGGEYIPIGPQLDVAVPEGATVMTGWDMNQDEGHELLFAGPRADRAPREVLVFDFVGNQPRMITLNLPGAFLQLADVDRDGFGDLMQLHNTGALQSLSFQQGSYQTRTPATLDEHAAFGLIELDGDDEGIPELLLAGDELWHWYTGSRNTNASENWYGVTPPSLGDLEIRVDGPLVPAELDGDDETLDWVGYEIRVGQIWLQASSHDPVEGTTTPLAEVALESIGSEPLDLAVCDGIAWALVSGVLHRVNLNGPLITGSANTPATAVDCGSGPLGSKAVLLESSQVLLLDNAINVLGQEPAAGAEDVAVHEGQVLTCGQEDCRVIAWEGPGDFRFVIAGDALSISDGEQEEPIPGSGSPLVADLDGDGHQDVILLDERAVWVLRNAGESLGTPEVFHTPVELGGVGLVADLSGDGHGDLVFADASGELLYTLDPVPWAHEPADSPEDTGP